jgi:hypothetical protein
LNNIGNEICGRTYRLDLPVMRKFHEIFMKIARKLTSQKRFIRRSKTTLVSGHYGPGGVVSFFGLAREAVTPKPAGIP